MGRERTGAVGRRGHGRVILLGLLLGWGTAFGAEPGLYQAEVGVTGQEAEARAAAVRDALARVAVKVTGVEPAPVTIEPETLPEGLVQQYAFRPHCSYPEDQGDAPWCLWVDFDPAAVRGWLRDQGADIWTAPRPAMLVWAMVAGNGRRDRVGRDDAEWQAVVDRVARTRGAALTLPVQDASDRQALPDGALWGDFEHDVRAASTRYAPQVVLVGRVRQTNGSWEARWTLYPPPGPPLRWREQAPTGTAAFEAGLRAAVNRVAALDRGDWTAPGTTRETPDPVIDAPVQGTLIEVLGVEGLGDYAKIQASLQGHPATRDIQLLAVEQGRLWLRLPPQGDRAAVVRTLARTPGWQPVRDDAPDAGRNTQHPARMTTDADLLRYRWTP